MLLQHQAQSFWRVGRDVEGSATGGDLLEENRILLELKNRVREILRAVTLAQIDIDPVLKMVAGSL